MYRSAVSFRSKLARLEGNVPREDAAPAATRETANAEAAPPARPAVLDALRARMRSILERAMPGPAPPRAVDTPDLPFTTTETESGPLHLRRIALSPAHRTGRHPILPARTASPSLLALLALDPSLAACDPAGALYLDTETTGLAGGTGTVAFLVGLARWEESELVLEQVLVRNLGEEAPMLEHVAARMADASMLVTFNGKSFDLPLLRTRFVMARIAPPRELPHLDLVHVARRLHKRRGLECKLTSLERDLLGFVRHDDVASGDVSACYLHFLRTGDTTTLLGVIEHNAWDVVAMAALVGLYGEPLEGSQLDPNDLVGLARTLRRAGAVDDALDAVNLAVGRGAGHDSLRARAEIAKARGDRARALADYAALVEQVDDPSARLELAKLYEHFAKDPARALDVVTSGTNEAADASERRAERLRRKAARALVQPTLFGTKKHGKSPRP